MARMSDHDPAGGPHTASSAAESTEKPASHRAQHRSRRKQRPEALSLIIEFFRMSRATAILLIVFVLTTALYMLVRQDPVVAFNSPPRPDSSQTDTTGTDGSLTEEPTSSDQPSDSTDPSDAQTPTGTSATESSLPGGPRGIEPEQGQDGGQSPPQQSPAAPQPPAGQPPQSSQQFEQTQVPVS